MCGELQHEWGGRPCSPAAQAPVADARQGRTEEAPEGGTEAIGTIQVGHGPPALRQRRGPIRGRRHAQLAKRDGGAGRASRHARPGPAAAVPARRGARRGGWLVLGGGGGGDETGPRGGGG